MDSNDTSGDTAHALGYDVLGPVFTCFAHLLLRHAHRMNCKRLGFIGRDGDLLMQVTEHLPVPQGFGQRPEPIYISLSRRSTALPAQSSINHLTLLETSAVRAGSGTWSEGLACLGLGRDVMAPIFSKYGIDIDKARITVPSATAIANDPEFQACVAVERERQKRLLARYLEQHRIGQDPSLMLVDIGWRGTILHNLQRAFSADATFRLPATAFFGLWPEDGNFLDLPADSIGLIADRRRSCRITEGSAWYVASLLEAICRASEGTTLGYTEVDGKLAPLNAPLSPSLNAETNTRWIADRIRQGILDYVETRGGDRTWTHASDARLRSKAQRALLRLGFFPSRAEIALGEQLVHTETHSPDWVVPLIATDRPHPLRFPRRWLAGFTSPWRTGYVRSSGGLPLAIALLLFESVLLALPPAIKTRLTEYARTVADINRNGEATG